MDKLTYYIEALHLQLETEPEEGLMLWSQLFDQARDAWQTNFCRLLLRQLKAATLPETLDPLAILLARSSEGMWLAQLEQWDEAVASCEKGLAVARQIGDPASEAWLLFTLGNIYYLTGQLNKATEIYEDTLRLYRHVQHRSGEALVLGNLGNIRLDQEDAPGAIEYYQAALTCYEDLGQLDYQAAMLTNLGNAYHHIFAHYTESQI